MFGCQAEIFPLFPYLIHFSKNQHFLSFTSCICCIKPRLMVNSICRVVGCPPHPALGTLLFNRSIYEKNTPARGWRGLTCLGVLYIGESGSQTPTYRRESPKCWNSSGKRAHEGQPSCENQASRVPHKDIYLLFLVRHVSWRRSVCSFVKILHQWKSPAKL